MQTSGDSDPKVVPVDQGFIPIMSDSASSSDIDSLEKGNGVEAMLEKPDATLGQGLIDASVPDSSTGQPGGVFSDAEGGMKLNTMSWL